MMRGGWVPGGSWRRMVCDTAVTCALAVSSRAFGCRKIFTIDWPLTVVDSRCSMLSTVVVSTRSNWVVIRPSISSGFRPVNCHATAITGMSMFGKMSVGVRRMSTGLSNKMSTARTTNVYGRCSATLTIHMSYGCGGGRRGFTVPRHRPGCPPGQATSRPSRLRKKRMTTALLFSTRLGEGAWAQRCDALHPLWAVEARRRRTSLALCETTGGGSYGLGREVSDPHPVVRGEGEGEHPVHPAGAPVPCLAHQSDGLEPAEDLFDALPPTLAHRIARVTGGAAVDRAGAVRGVLRYVRRHAEQPDCGDEVPRVVPFAGPERHAGSQIPGAEQLQRRRAFGVATRPPHAPVDGEAVTVLHQHV